MPALYTTTVPAEALASGNWLTCAAMALLNPVATEPAALFAVAMPLEPPNAVSLLNNPAAYGNSQTSFWDAGPLMQSICPMAAMLDIAARTSSCSVGCFIGLP